MSAYYRAKLRLKAFDSLEGWGSMDGDEFVQWSMTQQMEKAERLLSWALGEPAPAAAASDKSETEK